MESTLSIQKEVTLLESILKCEPAKELKSIEQQVPYVCSLFEKSVQEEAWSHPKIQPVLMRMLLLLDQKAFHQSYSRLPTYKRSLSSIVGAFISNSKLSESFAKQLNGFFSKKKFNKFPQSVGLLAKHPKYFEIFKSSVVKEIEKDLQGLEKDSKSLFAGGYSFLTPDFVSQKVVPLFSKLLRKSLKNLSKIRIWLSKMDTTQNPDFSNCVTLILFLESNLCDALNKDESFQKEFFAVSQKILGNTSKHCHLDAKCQAALVKFLSNMVSKLKSKRNDGLMKKMVQTLLKIEGVQNEKVLKSVFDAFWMALNNSKDEENKLFISKAFLGIKKIENLPQMLTLLSQKMKDKKDVIMVSPLLNDLLTSLDFTKIKIKKKKSQIYFIYQNKTFTKDKLEEMLNQMHGQVSQLIQIVGTKSASTVSSIPDTASPTLMTAFSYIYNSFFALLSKVQVSEMTKDKLEELKSIKCKDQIMKQIHSWRCADLDAPDLKTKIIQVLFKTNSILFRKSFGDSLRPFDCRVLLQCFQLLGQELVDYLKKKKMENLFSLFVYELVCKVLNSTCSSEAYVRGKYQKLMKSIETHDLWELPLGLTCVLKHPLFSKGLLLNHFTSELLLNGMFIHMIGSRYSLHTHQNIKKIMSFFKYEQINVFELMRSSRHLPESPISPRLKLMCLLSVADFDNSISSNCQHWENVIQVRSKESQAHLLDLWINNFSQLTQKGDFSGSIQLGNLKTILGDDDEKLEEFFERIVSEKGIFSRNYTVRQFCIRLVALLALNDSSYLIHRLNWLVNSRNLSKLTRMNKIIKYLKMDDLELEEQELSQPEWFAEGLSFLLGSFGSTSRFTDYLQDYGYNHAQDIFGSLQSKGYPEPGQLTEDRTGIFELCSDLQAIEDNEDEQMSELELNSKKDRILETYSFYLESISCVLHEMLQVCDGLSSPQELRVSQNCIILLNSVQANIDEGESYMKPNMKGLFLKVYLLSSRKNNVSGLIEFFYFIKVGRDDSSFIRSIERACEALENRPEFYSEHLFEMFFAVLNFLVEQQLSAKAKKNVLTIVIGFLDKFPSYEQQLFEFLVNTINNFYFDFAFEKVEEILKKALANKDEQSNKLDLIFQNILEYQDYARERMSNILLRNKESISETSMKVFPISKLKLIYLSRDQDSNVIAQSTELLKVKNLGFNMESFLELSFEEMLIQFPPDTHDTFALIFKELYMELPNPQKNTFISAIAQTFDRIADNIKSLSEEHHRFEFKLMLIPRILNTLVEDIKGTNFLSFFHTFNKIEESKLAKITDVCLGLGRELIQKQPADLSKLISSQTRQMDPARPLITPIVFVAECAKVNPHLSSQIGDLQSDLEKLLIIQDKAFMRNLAKQLRYLIHFLKDPQKMLERLFANVLKNNAKDTLTGHCYFIAGLLKGLGIRFFKKTNIISRMQKVFDASVKKDYKDIHVRVRKGCVVLSEALWLVFDRLLEPSLKQLLDFLLKFLGDSNEEVRSLTRNVMDQVMLNISEFGIKQILPILMKGTVDKNSKIKCNSILALGSIANCGTKQLSQNLPKIVPQLTEATNDTNDKVNSAAKESLSKILGTIRSPEVANLRDILIKSLSDPFNHNQRSLEAILKTKFKHALDGPSLSLIVPIALYGCKTINKDQSKIMASQLIASMIELVPKAADFLPHLDSLMKGLTENLKDLSSEVRAMSAKAFAALTKKFKNEIGMKLLNQLKKILETEDANSTERAGFAQAFAEVLYSMGPETVQTLIPQALLLTQDGREHIRESFLSVFVYIPMVMGNLFIDFVPVTIEHVVESISHEKEKIRNLAIKSLKIIIQNYLQNDFQVLLRPLFEGCLHVNENKKNSSLILLGDIIQMLFENDQLSRDFIYENYARIFSLFYIIKNDESSEVRETAKNIYKTFIPNTQRCLRIIFKDLHECFIELFSREQDAARTLARNGLIEFGNKFADTFASEMLTLGEEILKKRMQRHSEILQQPDWKQQLSLSREINKIESLLAGQSRFIAEFVASCNNSAMRKVKNLGLINVNNLLCDFTKEVVWSAAFVGLRTFVDRENKTEHITERLTRYSNTLSKNEAVFKTTGHESDETDKLNEKMKKFFTILLQSKKEMILKETTSFLFTRDFKEWQFEVILQNLKLFGNLLYENGPLKSGLDLLFKSYTDKSKEYQETMTQGQKEFLEMNKFTLNTLSVNIDPNNIPRLIEEYEHKLVQYTAEKDGLMILLTLQSLSNFFEKSVIEDIQFPFSLCASSLKLIAYNDSSKKEIFNNVGSFLEIMFRSHDKENCTEIMTGIYNTLKEIVSENESYEGLENKKVIRCLFSLINKVLRYSTPDSTQMALKTAKFLVKTLPQELFAEDQRALYSALLRLLIYQYSPKQGEPLILKKKLFSFMNFLLEKKIDMGTLKHQFYIYLVMLINSEYKKEQELKQNQEENDEEENKETKTESVKKTMKNMSLREVYMQYVLNLGNYFDCLMSYISNWNRKVNNDTPYYATQPFDDFLLMINEQPEDLVSTKIKSDISKIYG